MSTELYHALTIEEIWCFQEMRLQTPCLNFGKNNHDKYSFLEQESMGFGAIVDLIKLIF